MRRITLLMLLLALVLVACTPAAPATPGTTDTTAPTAAPAEEATMAPEVEATTAPEMEATAVNTDTSSTGGDTEGMITADMIEGMGEGLSASEDGLLTLASEGCGAEGYVGSNIESIAAVDRQTVVFTMCNPDPAFEAKVAFEGFGIQSAEHLMEMMGGADLLENPVGTGPFMLEEWVRGDSLILARNDEYWGDLALDSQMVIRWAEQPTTRLTELQAATVDQIAFVGPEDIETVEADGDLQLLPSANPNIFYLGMTNTFEPFNDVRVRQALAMGIDRQRIVDNYYPAGSEVASHFTPCSIPGGCEGEEWYEFDPEAARALLAEAMEEMGMTEFSTRIYYRDVARVYLPEAPIMAQELQNQLQENLGITLEIVPMESGEFLTESSAGNLDGLYMLGWGADYPHPTNFLDYHFGANNVQFGEPFAEIYEPLAEAAQLADAEEAAALYEEANNQIRELVPMIPIAHGAAADAARADAEGANTRPFGAVDAKLVDTPDDVFVFMGSAEPISLYCADETDGETFRACGQIVESLLAYALESGDTVPALATECTGNEDATEWTCALREGVTFHDGSTFDANDVVVSFAAGLDGSSPLHVGNSGVFEYWSYLWGPMYTEPAAEE